MNWNTTTAASRFLYGLSRSLSSRTSTSGLLSQDAVEEERGDVLGPQGRAQTQLEPAGAEDQAAQRGGGDLGGDRELVAVRLEHACESGVELGLGAVHELRRSRLARRMVGLVL